jgi:hypothetical protein
MTMKWFLNNLLYKILYQLYQLSSSVDGVYNL